MSDGAAGPPGEQIASQGGHPPSGREGAAAELSVRSRMILRRSIGSPLLFTVVYTSLASAIYFSLGVIAGHALGLTPLVFLLAALLFALTAMTYAEGASLHPERSGSTVFARYAFNELVELHRRLGDPARLHHPDRRHALTRRRSTCVCSGVRWATATESLGLALAFIALVVLGNIRGFGWRRARRVGVLVVGDLALQALHRRARAGAVLQPAHAARPDPPGQRADSGRTWCSR